MLRRPFLAPAIVLMAITLPIAIRVGRAQSPQLSGARLHASVEIDPHGVFLYKYSVENGASSTTGVSKITIDLSVPAGASMPSASGLAHGLGYFAEPSTGGRNSKAGAVIPVGLSAPQPGWRTTVGADAAARWVATNEKDFVLPKQRLAGFSIVSHGPPSIRRYTIVPHIDPGRAPIMEPGDDPGEVDRFKQDFDHYVESRSMVGATLAPSALRKMTADDLLANLVSQIAQARTTRWITSDAAARNLTEKLQAVRAAIARHQSEAAGNILRGLRTEAAAQSGKTLTGEAVALVDVNVQYALALIAKP